MSAIDDIYNFERVFEDSLKAVFIDAEIKAFTSQDAPEFQKDRPRVEIFFVTGAGRGQLIPHPITGVETETAWKGTYTLQIITAADMAIHAAFRTRVRYLMMKLRGIINDVPPMTLHCLQFLSDGGTSPVLKPESGDYQSAMAFEIDFSIQGNAWALLSEDPNA